MSSRLYEMQFQLQAQLNRNFNQAFSQARGQIATLQTSIDALQRKSSDISGYQKQAAAVEKTASQLALLQTQYDNIQKEIAETEKFSSSLANKLAAKDKQIKDVTQSLETQRQKLQATAAAMKDAGVNMDNLGQESAQLRSEIADLQQQQTDAAESAQNMGSKGAEAFMAMGHALAAAGIVDVLKRVVSGMQECYQAAVTFESGLAGVDKTVDLTSAELAEMSDTFKALSTEIPVTTTELMGVAEVAGQLGIEKDHLVSFTETMAMLGTATNMTAEHGATMLAQFANITQMPVAEYSNLGSAIVDLGNNFATTEEKIADMSQGIAAAGSLAGMSEADILGMAAAVSSLGIESAMGGTAVSTLISTLQKAVETGEGLEDFARVANLTAEEFAHAWGNNAVGALEAFVTGLTDTERIGASAIVTLENLGITETRLQRTVLSLSNAGDVLTGAVERSNAAWEQNNALQTEAGKRYATTESLQIMAKNAFDNLTIAIGDSYLPLMQKVYEAVTALLEPITAFVEKNQTLVAGLSVFIGVAGAAAAAIVGISAAMKLFAAASTFVTAALAPYTGILLGVSAVAGLVAMGVTAMSTAADDAVAPLEELAAQARGLDEALATNAQNFEQTQVSMLATANVADRYITALEEMGDYTQLSASAQQDYKNTLSALCAVLPDVAHLIDVGTGSIEGGTEALRANTAAWAENARQQAQQDYITELYQTHSAVIYEQEANTIALAQANKALDEAQAGVATTTEEMALRFGEAGTKAHGTALAYGSMWNYSTLLGTGYGDLSEKLRGYESQVETSEAEVRRLEAALAEGADATLLAEDAIAQAAQTLSDMGLAANAAGGGMSYLTAGYAEMEIAIQGAEQAIGSLVAMYDEAYAAALSSVQGQFSLWDNAETLVPTDINQVTQALQSQITHWQSYDSNLASLGNRTGEIAGLGDVLASFANGSSESIAAVAGMAQATDEELAGMVESWNALQNAHAEVAESLALVQTKFDESMTEIVASVTTAVEDMDLSSESAVSAKNTIDGFINQATAMIPMVEVAYARVAQAAMDAVNRTLDINSPSKEMMKKAHFAWEGFILGAKQDTPKVETAMAGTALAGVLAVAEQAKALESMEIVGIRPQLFEVVHAYQANQKPSTATASQLVQKMQQLETLQTFQTYETHETYTTDREYTRVLETTTGGGAAASGEGMTVNFSPVYNISGGESDANVKKTLEQHDVDLKAYILETLAKVQKQADRRAFR